MGTVANIPLTASGRAELGDELIRIPATWEEYVGIAEDCEYPTEYDNREIILMSIASGSHEVIVMNIGTCLNIALADELDMAVRGSNRHIFIPEYQKDFAPDVHVVNGEPKMHTLRKGLTANVNPWLVVEVHSRSTYRRDMQEKLPFYKKIDSLQYIVYIEQDFPLVSVYSRVGGGETWGSIDCLKLTDSFEILNKKILLTDIYKKVNFPKKED